MHINDARQWIGRTITLGIAVAISGSAAGQMTEETVQVGWRAASFLQPRLSGVVPAAIVYQPGNEASEREARVIERQLAGGLGAGSLRLTPRKVSATALHELAGTRVAFVTRGTNYRQIGSAAAARSILTITSDLGCVRGGYCALAVQSAPKVQITVSRAACTAAKVRFNSAFLMLVKEI